MNRCGQFDIIHQFFSARVFQLILVNIISYVYNSSTLYRRLFPSFFLAHPFLFLFQQINSFQFYRFFCVACFKLGFWNKRQVFDAHMFSFSLKALQCNIFTSFIFSSICRHQKRTIWNRFSKVSNETNKRSALHRNWIINNLLSRSKTKIVERASLRWKAWKIDSCMFDLSLLRENWNGYILMFRGFYLIRCH